MGRLNPGRGNRTIVAIGAAALVVMLAVAGLAVWLFGGGGAAGGATPVARIAPATAPPVSTYSGDIAALPRNCASIPSGTLPPYLAVADAAASTATDPSTGRQTPAISVRLSGPIPSGAAPYSVTIVVLPYSATAAAGTGAPMDSAGTLQLIALWDGHTWHRGIRNWNGSSWNVQTDADATGLDLTTNNPLVFYWNGLSSGSSFGEVVAASNGCADHDLDNQLVPQKEFSG